MLTKHVYDIQLEKRKSLPVATKVGFSFMKLLGRKLISFLNSLLIYLVIKPMLLIVFHNVFYIK